MAATAEDEIKVWTAESFLSPDWELEQIILVHQI